MSRSLLEGPRLRPRSGSWRVALRYARRDALRHKGRTALVATMVMLPAGLGAAVAVLVVSTTTNPASRVADELGPDRSVQASIDFQSPGRGFQDPADTTSGSSTDAPLDPIFRTPDGKSTVDDTSTVLPVDADDYQRALAATLPADDTLVPVVTRWGVSVSPSDDPGLRTTSSVAQLDTTGAARHAFGVSSPVGAGQVAVDRQVAHDLHVGVGDTVDLAVTEGSGGVLFYAGEGSFSDDGAAHSTRIGRFTVSELIREDGLVLGADGPLTPPERFDFWRADAAQQDYSAGMSWLVVGPTAVTWDDIQHANGLGATVFSRQVVLDPPDDAVAAFEAEYYPDGGYTSSVSGEAAAVVGGAVTLGLLQAILMIGPAFQVGARRSARDLALLAANGADARTVRRTVLAGAVVVGTTTSVAATTTGTLAAVAGLRAWSTMVPVVPWWWLAAFATVGTTIAVAAAWLPARRAGRVDPVLVLAGRRADAVPRRWPAVVGAALAAAGVLTALVGAATHQSVAILVAGIVLAEVGLVIAAGAIVGGLAMLARHLHGTPRLALRDAARHRARTAPAVAAVLAATAAAVAGLVTASSQAQHDELSYRADAATGTFLVGPLGDTSQELDAGDRASVTRVVDAAHVLDGNLLPVESVRTRDAGDDTPVWIAPATPDDSGAASVTRFDALGTVVDDGSSLDRLELLGVPDPERAATALAARRLVVPPSLLAADGTATVVLTRGDESRTYHLPATAVGDDLSTTNLPLVPPSVVRDLGLRSGTSALMGRAKAGTWSEAVRTTLDAALEQAVPTPTKSGDGSYATASAYVEPGRPPWNDGPLLAEALIAGGALLVALAAAWIATALAGTESLPDLATLQAVGAPPRTRRRFAAAQSSVITITGAVLGAATGLVIGATVVLAQREHGEVVDRTWMIDVPWLWVAALVVAIPALGALASWAVSRSRLPMTRRLDR